MILEVNQIDRNLWDRGNPSDRYQPHTADSDYHYNWHRHVLQNEEKLQDAWNNHGNSSNIAGLGPQSQRAAPGDSIPEHLHQINSSAILAESGCQFWDAAQPVPFYAVP